MDRLLQMDKARYVAEMRAEMERVLSEVADAVNAAPDGKVIAASEWQVHDLMEELRRVAYEKALQMRIDSTEGAFSPSEGCGGPVPAKQGAGDAKRQLRQRPCGVASHTLVCPHGGVGHADGPAAGRGGIDGEPGAAGVVLLSGD